MQACFELLCTRRDTKFLSSRGLRGREGDKSNTEVSVIDGGLRKRKAGLLISPYRRQEGFCKMMHILLFRNKNWTRARVDHSGDAGRREAEAAETTEHG